MKNKYFYTLEYIVIYLVGMFIYSCSNSGPEPVKDPRKYTWTIDTIQYPGSYRTRMNSIWGSSSDNVYIVGYDGGIGIMCHYDGKKWEEVKLMTRDGGTIDHVFSLYNILGFSKNDIWAVGECGDNTPYTSEETRNFAMHFDGRQWKEVNLYGGKWLSRLWGDLPSNLYTAGEGGIIRRFDGVSWTKDTFPIKATPNSTLQIGSIIEDKNGNLLVNAKLNQWVPYCLSQYFFKFNNNQWELIDSVNTDIGYTERNIYNYARFWRSPEGNTYSIPSDAAYLWDGNKFIRAPGAINNNYPGSLDFYGTSENNIFAVSLKGKVCHFNGSNWHYFNELADFNITYSCVWTDGTEVFIIGTVNKPDRSIATVILHGK